MRRTFVVSALVAALMVFAAGPAFAAHCVNLSKKAGAGNHTTVTVNLVTDEVTVEGNGGYANVWLDFDGDGVGDFLAEADVQVGRNHSPSYQDVEAWVNPGAINKASNPNASHDHGMGFHEGD